MTDDPLYWLLPQAALDRSFEELAADGGRGREGIVLWAGTSNNASPPAVSVTHVILLRGEGVRRGCGYISIAPALLNEVTDALAAVGDGVYLVGQIHGHPPFASTDLSEVDIAYGIRTPLFLSVVAPSYGMENRARLGECGVHVFEPQTGWRRLERDEARTRIAVLDSSDADIACLTIGVDNSA